MNNPWEVKESEKKKKIQGVMYVQHTEHSKLAKLIREKLKTLEDLGCFKLKVVERTGDKLVDLLHRSNAWSNVDCLREDCVVCSSAGEKEVKGMCRRRNITYETFCVTCQKLEAAELEKEVLQKENHIPCIEEKENNMEDILATSCIEVWERSEIEISEKENEKKRKRERKVKTERIDKEKKKVKFKYIGESSRSCYERGKEHWTTFEDLSPTSHILKHYLLEHEGLKMEDLEFGIKVTGSYRSALERQIAEAIKIEFELEKGTKLLNSKAEFNRCEIPRLKIGSRKQELEELKKENDLERKLKEKMRIIKKRKKDKQIMEEMSNPSLKRVCIEILNQENREWTKKKRKIDKENRILEEERGEKEMEKIRRLERARQERKNLLGKLRKKGALKPTKRDLEWIETRKSLWRQYREEDREKEKEEDEETMNLGSKEVHLDGLVQENGKGGP